MTPIEVTDYLDLVSLHFEKLRKGKGQGWLFQLICSPYERPQKNGEAGLGLWLCCKKNEKNSIVMEKASGQAQSKQFQ